MKGKTVIVTGASGGIGGAIVSELLERGADVIGACRRPQRLPEHPRLRGLELDLASFASVRRAAGMLEGERIYGIVSNAGIMPVRETVITADGLERTYQVNYEGDKDVCGVAFAAGAAGRCGGVYEFGGQKGAAAYRRCARTGREGR